METTLFHSYGRFLAVPLLLLIVADLALAQGQQQAPPPGYYPPNFSPSMAIVIVVLIAAFFFLGFFSIYMRHCYGEGAGYSATALPNGTGAAARSRRQRGLDAAVLETFPTMAYADVKEHKAVKGALECAVCLSEFDDDETLRLLPKCSHVFHPDCIDTWLASHVTCPVCRANLVPDPDAPADDVPEVQAPASQPQESPLPAPAPDAVVIDVEETEEERIIRQEAAELMRIGSVKRALRSKSGRAPARFPRSHSTAPSGSRCGCPTTFSRSSPRRGSFSAPQASSRSVPAATAARAVAPESAPAKAAAASGGASGWASPGGGPRSCRGRSRPGSSRGGRGRAGEATPTGRPRAARRPALAQSGWSVTTRRARLDNVFDAAFRTWSVRQPLGNSRCCHRRGAGSG